MSQHLQLVDAYLERATGPALDVDFPERTMDLIVIPYDEEITVDMGGQAIRESVAPGAFDGIERRANRITVNREHKRELVFGRAVALYPKRPEGLVAKVKVSRTTEGDAALELAADGILGASAGFKPTEVKWLGRDQVRYMKCWLGHIALTSEQAYPGAKVLAVRSVLNGQPAPVRVPQFPNLERWRAEESERRLAAVVASQQPNYQPL